MIRLLRQTAVIARRDFLATVATPTFLVFLLAPMLLILFAVVGGTGAAMIAESGGSSLRIVALVDADHGARLEAADERMRRVLLPPSIPPPLVIRPPGADPAAEARAIFADPERDVSAVLYGPAGRPRILHSLVGTTHAAWLADIAEQAALIERAGGPPRAPLTRATLEQVARTASTDSGQRQTGLAAIFVIFLLTLMLAGQSVSMLAEEKSNKVIEILAAAVPLEAVFLGKLTGLFGVAMLFVGFWGGLAALAFSAIPGGGALIGALHPAVGLGPFVALGIVYFAMGYLLLGAVFLGVGAQAGSMREIQMMSLPITLFQMAMFGLASAAASAGPGTLVATIGEVFPFSSPFAMAAKAANDPALWPHLLAIAWQALWVSLTIALSARWFRRGVLKSGGGRRGLFRRKVMTAD